VLLGAFVVLKSFLLRKILSMSCVNAACSSTMVQKPERRKLFNYKKNKNKNTRKDWSLLVSFSLIKRTRQNQNHVLIFLFDFTIRTVDQNQSQNQNSCSKGGLTPVIFPVVRSATPGKCGVGSSLGQR